jgi:hypothetical protein
LKHFTAETYGRRVKYMAFLGEVHSVFAEACNIETNDGELITLLNRTKPDHPGAIRVNLPKDFNFRDWLKIANLVSCQHGCLQIEEPNFVVDMRKATLWDGCLNIHLVDPTEPKLVRQWEASAQLYLSLIDDDGNRSKRPNSNTSTVKFFPKLYTLASKLTTATTREDWEIIYSTVRSLIGLGPGLTPWGDDFLCGFVAGFESFSQDLNQRNTLVCLRNILRKNLSGTGDISRSILNDALNGLHGRPITDTCHALFCLPLNLDLSIEVKKLIRIGNTSGAATCLGILSGSAAAIKFDIVYTKYYKNLMAVLINNLSLPNLEMGREFNSQ